MGLKITLDDHIRFINTSLNLKQVNINVKSRRFGFIMTPFSRQNE